MLTNIPSGNPSEYPAAGQAAKYDEGLRDERNTTLSAVPSICPTPKAIINPKVPINPIVVHDANCNAQHVPTYIPSPIQFQSSFQVSRVGGAYVGTISLRSMYHASYELFVWGALYLRCEQYR